MLFVNSSARLFAVQKVAGLLLSVCAIFGPTLGLSVVIPQQIAEAAPIQYYNVKTGGGTWVLATKKGGKYMTCAGEPIIGWLQVAKSDGGTCGG